MLWLNSSFLLSVVTPDYYCIYRCTCNVVSLGYQFVFHRYQVKLEDRILPNHVMVVPPNVLTWFMFIQV